MLVGGVVGNCVRGASLWAGLLVALLWGVPALAAPPDQAPSPSPGGEALVIVERAVVFSTPERSAETLTYLFERERVPVLGQSPDGRFVQVAVDGALLGWVLRAQVELAGGELPVIGGPAVEPTALSAPNRTPTARPTRTPRPSPTAGIVPSFTPSATFEPNFTPSPTSGVPPVLPGTAPPLTIALPEGWESLDLFVPLQTFAGETHDVPLTIYFGPLPGGANGFIYLYWGFPNTVEMSGEYNLWADAVQILRGSLIGESCNLGVYAQEAFEVGGRAGVGAYYQASECEDEDDAAGWFVALRVGEGSYAFFTAVEPWAALTEHQATLEAALASVEFQPAED